MKKLNMNNVKAFFNKLQFGIKKHSPEILISLGVVGAVASTVMACVATTKIKDILEESKAEIGEIHKEADKCEENNATVEQSTKKALTSVYLRTIIKVVKLYTPSVVLGGLSLASIITSNNILRKRNVALAAAYAAIDNGFKTYRANVVERYGEDVDKELRYGVKTQKITEKVTDTESGKETKTKKDVKVSSLGIDGYSDYARYFDCDCSEWSHDHEYNMMILRAKEHYANDLLRAKGYLFLNDVYKELGIKESKAGQVVGWVYDKNNDVGDNYVSFGIFETNRSTEDGVEPTIILDFNVDGYIMDRASLTL